MTALAERVQDTRWYEQGLCREVGSYLFDEYEDENGGDAVQRYRVAKAVCAECPVREACLRDTMKYEAGLGPKFRQGVFGGLSARQRYRLDPTAGRRVTAYRTAETQ